MFIQAEIADFIEKIESLSEDEGFRHKELAAAVASRCFYHLEDYDDGYLFNIIINYFYCCLY